MSYLVEPPFEPKVKRSTLPWQRRNAQLPVNKYQIESLVRLEGTFVQDLFIVAHSSSRYYLDRGCKFLTGSDHLLFMLPKKFFEKLLILKKPLLGSFRSFIGPRRKIVIYCMNHGKQNTNVFIELGIFFQVMFCQQQV